MPASEERSISEFPSALSILATTLLLVSTYDSGNDAYDSEKVTAVDLASAILGDFEYTQDLATNVKTIFGAINSIMVLSGTTVPSSAIGSNGQLYFKYSSSGGTDTVDAMYWKINNAWIEVSTGGGGGGASVTLGTTVPSDASGSNGDLYVQYDGTTYAVIEYFVKINGSWRKSPYSRVVALTQAEYDLITPDPTTLYIITDAQSSYQTKTDNSLATTDKTVVGAINEHQSEIGVSEYDSTQTYNIGDYVLYNGDMYFCKENSVTGAWNSNHWGKSTIVIDLSNIVVKRTLTETTTGNGNVVNYISVDNGIIVDARCTSQEAIVTTFLNSLGTHYSFHVVSPTSQAPVVANTKVTIEFYMIPSRRIVTDT